MLYAHSLENRPESDWEPLERHLSEVAELAAAFAACFSAEDWGRVAGLWHDLGKARPEFQALLRGAHIRVEHAGLGAALAESKPGALRRVLAFVIAGHHSGLSNEETRAANGLAPLRERIACNRTLLPLLASLPSGICDCSVPDAPAWIRAIAALPSSSTERRRRLRLSVDMFVRFLFSAVVDADRLATERFVDSNADRDRPWPTLATINARLDTHLATLQVSPDRRSPVNVRRDEVLQACRSKACAPKGIFSLTVPTGGGKTLSAMSFALRHALANGQRRVIVVIPYTSIIEQNAAIYRAALGADVVVEHHANFDEAAAWDDSEEREARRRCAVENWDAPIIVTTSVQFLETLFTNRPSRARKLHNVAGSVVVLDEVQTLPPELLTPILDALNELQTHFDCSILLSTATPPALLATAARPFGLRGVTEVIPAPALLASGLRRVKVRWPGSASEVTTWDSLAVQLATHRQVLAVVHRRQDARDLARRLPAAGAFHLSASMCPAHRSLVLERVRRRLSDGAACRLVSTQLIEAGVDIDFPVAYRALAGLDSLAQAAGRCNREGRLRDGNGYPTLGEFVVFRAETDPPPGVLRRARDIMNVFLVGEGGSVDIHDPGVCQRFFDALYALSDVDARAIQSSRSLWNFADVGLDFKIIDEYSEPLVVLWGEARGRLDEYRRAPSRATRRALQPFVVTVPPKHMSRLREGGGAERVDEFVWALSEPCKGIYSEEFGLQVEDLSVDPGQFVI